MGYLWDSIRLPRYKLTIQYDGSVYCGWQLQKNEKTIQGILESAIRKISGSENRIPIYGAGRTDAGVHAWKQVAHIDLNTRLSENEINNALNGNLPDDCRIMAVERVSNDFQARFDAIRRYYRYQIYQGDSILFRNQAWHLDLLDIECLNDIGSIFLGEHDFLSFSKYRKDLGNTNCMIHKSEWNVDGKMLIFSITGNRFLHHMIRYLVGSMVAVSRKQFTKERFSALLNNPKRNVKIFKAPAHGLILERIDYE